MQRIVFLLGGKGTHVVILALRRVGGSLWLLLATPWTHLEREREAFAPQVEREREGFA